MEAGLGRLPFRRASRTAAAQEASEAGAIVAAVTNLDESYVLGVNLAGGTAYCAVASPPDRLVDDPLVRIELAEGLEPAEQLIDLGARFQQELNRLQPVAVGIVQTLKRNNWVYSKAWRRATVEAVVMLTVADASTSERPIAYRQIGPKAMAKAAGIQLKTLQEDCAERWGDRVPMYRKERFPAVAGAMALLKEFCS